MRWRRRRILLAKADIGYRDLLALTPPPTWTRAALARDEAMYGPQS